MDWQTAAVIAIEALAVAFLVQRMVAGRRPKRATAKPDVSVSALVRRRR